MRTRSQIGKYLADSKERARESDKFMSRYSQHKKPKRAKCGHMTYLTAKSTGLCCECDLAHRKRPPLFSR